MKVLIRAKLTVVHLNQYFLHAGASDPEDLEYIAKQPGLHGSIRACCHKTDEIE